MERWGGGEQHIGLNAVAHPAFHLFLLVDKAI